MMSVPRVSVLVPNYNHARYLPRRIESILAQTYQDFELIVLDDASTDDSRAVIARYLSDLRVRFLPNERNSGSPFIQWNKGVAEARGALIWIAESDDYADPGLLARLVPLFEDRPRLALAYCQSTLVDVDDRVQPTTPATWLGEFDSRRWREDFENVGSRECADHLLWLCTIPNASAVVFRRNIFQQAGGASLELRLCGDWLTWARLLNLGDIAFLAQPLNYFRRHAATVRGSTTWRTYLEERWTVQRWIALHVPLSSAAKRKLAHQVAREMIGLARSADVRPRLPELRRLWRIGGPVIKPAPTVLAACLAEQLSQSLRRRFFPSVNRTAGVT